jgi:hypothetical protein
MCTHPKFAAECDVNRFEDTGLFSVDVRIRCVECNEPFRFIGLPAGILQKNPTVSIDGLELHAPIEPQGIPQLARRATFQMPKIPEKV